MSGGKTVTVPENREGWLVRNCVKESKRNNPLMLLADNSLSCIRSIPPPNFRACLPRVRTASSPPWKEFQERDLLDGRNPCAVGAPKKLVTPGMLWMSPANPPGTNLWEDASDGVSLPFTSRI